MLFLRGEVYRVDYYLGTSVAATAEEPVTIESYPGEWAVIEGLHPPGADVNANTRYNGFTLGSDSRYVRLRRLEIRYFGWGGAVVYGSHATVEGCDIHHNLSSGVVLYGGKWHEDDSDYVIPYPRCWNLVRDNVIHDNSDAELDSQGGNSDGVAVSSGRYNWVVHNLVYGNSDDGINTWRSNDSYVAYNVVYSSGIAAGDGNGIKAGGNLDPKATNGLRAVVAHNLAYQNRARGVDFNAGKNDAFCYNTVWNNDGPGFTSADDTRVAYNLAAANGAATPVHAGHAKNSWQLTGEPAFVSTDPASPDFLRPEPGSAFANLGAYADPPPAAADQAIYLIGDSTVHNTDFPNDQGGYYELGWGNVLGERVKNPDRLFNEARSGASSVSYREPSSWAHDWDETRALIERRGRGGYLLIQFGHNDEAGDTEPGRGGTFYQALAYYVSQARELGLEPVLITPVARMYPNFDTHGEYDDTVRLLAADMGVLLLDLEQKSRQVFDTYPTDAELQAEFGYDGHTHFNPTGARRVAGWVRDLACDSGDAALCAQFRRFFAE